MIWREDASSWLALKCMNLWTLWMEEVSKSDALPADDRHQNNDVKFVSSVLEHTSTKTPWRDIRGPRNGMTIIPLMSHLTIGEQCQWHEFRMSPRRHDVFRRVRISLHIAVSVIRLSLSNFHEWCLGSLLLPPIAQSRWQRILPNYADQSATRTTHESFMNSMWNDYLMASHCNF